ncbi:MAG: hypothetical protein IPL77_21905 [Flavobacteriales bacterium]|nr:hypothetical protein [Flavobacteriales bacterium]
MLTALKTYFDTGTGAIIEVYTEGFATLLATLQMAAVSFGPVTQVAIGAQMTAVAITADPAADETGRAAVFKILTQPSGTMILRGTAGEANEDLVFQNSEFTQNAAVEFGAQRSRSSLNRGKRMPKSTATANPSSI